MLRLLNSQLGRRNVIDDALARCLQERCPTPSIPNADVSTSEYYLVRRIINNSLFYNLCIDGMSCSGKSTVIERLSKEYSAPTYKINKELDCTDYNYDSNTAFHYALKQAMNYTKLKNCIIDRSIVSNLTFQLVYWLMSCDDSMFEKLSPHCLCANYIKMHQMEPVLEFIKAQNHNILIVVNSNFEQVGRMMVDRGSSGDTYKGRIPKYIESQYNAYVFMANVLDLPVFDHAKVEDSFGALHKLAARMFSLLSGNDEFAMIEIDQEMPQPVTANQQQAPEVVPEHIKRSKPTNEEWADRIASLNMNKR